MEMWRAVEKTVPSFWEGFGSLCSRDLTLFEKKRTEGSSPWPSTFSKVKLL